MPDRPSLHRQSSAVDQVTSTRTIWWCDNCAEVGHVIHRDDAGVWEVYGQIRDAHARASATTKCATHLSRVRIAIDEEHQPT